MQGALGALQPRRPLIYIQPAHTRVQSNKRHLAHLHSVHQELAHDDVTGVRGQARGVVLACRSCSGVNAGGQLNCLCQSHEWKREVGEKPFIIHHDTLANTADTFAFEMNSY